ncbi:unnamed protein product, partial [Discosporangium mesarthrocarpum]
MQYTTRAPQQRDVSQDNLRKLARRYHFHFVGDSTSRRLAASFEAVYTGKVPYHRTYHRTVYHNVRELSAVFKWKPYCEEISDEIARAMGMLGTEGKGRQLVFVTTYGIHEISKAHEEIRLLKGDITPENAFSIDGAAMDRCLNTTRALVDLAQRPGGLRPVVMVLQGNSFRPRDSRYPWMRELHRRRLDILKGGIHFRRRKLDVERSGEGAGGRGMPFMLEDQMNLFNRLECKRRDDIHFFEPVKLTQAQ